MFTLGLSLLTYHVLFVVAGDLMTEEQATALVSGKKVLVIDDGPTLTHGGMPYGAGYVMAQKLGAAEIVDPRPYAKGSLVGVFERFPHLANVLPAVGYGTEQVQDLEATIKATPCDSVVLGTPSDFTHVMDLNIPTVVARYELEVLPEHEEKFHQMLDSFYEKACSAKKIGNANDAPKVA